jgi:hypothetical protein
VFPDIPLCEGRTSTPPTLILMGKAIRLLPDFGEATEGYIYCVRLEVFAAVTMKNNRLLVSRNPVLTS